MDARHREYVEYYESRLARRSESPLYPETRKAEQALRDAIATAPTLEAFGDRIEAGQLTFQCAKARVVDQAAARLAVWNELGETVRAEEEAQVLREAPGAKDEHELAEVVQRAHSAARDAITVDEFHRMFDGDLDVLEDIEVFERAEVPERWRAHFQQHVAGLEQRGREDFKTQLENLHKYVPGARFDLDVVPQPRHRRLMPFPDAVLQRRFATFRRYRGL